MMVVVQRDVDQRQSSRIAPFRVAPTAARSGGGEGKERSSDTRSAAVGAVRPRPHRPSPAPLPERAPGQGDPAPVGSSTTTAPKAARREMAPTADPAPLPEVNGGERAASETTDRPPALAGEAPLAELTADDPAPAPREADQEAMPHADPVVPVDPYLRPALEAAAAARAAAARIRESARRHGGITVRRRWELNAPASAGVPLDGLRDRAGIVFRPLRRPVISPSDQAGDQAGLARDSVRPDHHLTVPPFRRHEPVRMNGPVHIEKEHGDSDEEATGDGRFRRFRAEVVSTSQQIDEDPAHPWAGKVPVPIAQAAPPRLSLWSRLGRLFGASGGEQETA
jgi:hypothetical protein